MRLSHNPANQNRVFRSAAIAIHSIVLGIIIVIGKTISGFA